MELLGVYSSKETTDVLLSLCTGNYNIEKLIDTVIDIRWACIALQIRHPNHKYLKQYKYRINYQGAILKK